MRIELGQSYSFIQQGTRRNQEDARFPDEDRPSMAQRVFLVCDGVGGNSKGEVASRTVCDAMGKVLANHDWEKTLTEKDFASALGKAYAALEKASVQARDMATTMAFVAFHGTGVMVAHIGDSRIYQVRPGVGIMYRSDDHSLVNVMVHTGQLSPDDAERHPKRHYITRSMSCVTGDFDPAAVLQISDVEAGDYFVVCTDGLLFGVTDDKLEEILELDIPDAEKIGLLRDLSKDSTDNSAVILIPVCNVETENAMCAHSSTMDQSGVVITEKSFSTDNEIVQVSPHKGLWDKVKSVFKK